MQNLLHNNLKSRKKDYNLYSKKFLASFIEQEAKDNKKVSIVFILLKS